MFSLDERTGNVVTTIALFVIAGVILYLARIAFLVLLLSVLFALLIEPAVIWFQNHSPFGSTRSGLAIAQVYLIGVSCSASWSTNSALISSRRQKD